MMQQEDWIAKKKAEIEEKIKKKDEQEGQSHQSQVKSPTKDSKKRPGFKNRWGFKGKVEQKSTAVTPAPVTNAAKIQFSNDGSFLQQFRKMQEQQKAKGEVQQQKEEVKVEVKTEVKAEGLRLKLNDFEMSN